MHSQVLSDITVTTKASRLLTSEEKKNLSADTDFLSLEKKKRKMKKKKKKRG